jgi:hypothetical protein
MFFANKKNGYKPKRVTIHSAAVFWLPEQVLLRTVKLRVKLPPPLRKKLLESVAPARAA